jgi:hypothetical protein
MARPRLVSRPNPERSDSGLIDAALATAVGTIALAVLTACYVVLTGKLSRQAAESAASAERSARAAEHAVAVARLQVMLDQMPRLTLRVVANAGLRFGALDQLTVQASNGGRSRAVDVDLRVVGDLAGDRPMRLAKWQELSPGGGNPTPTSMDVTERPSSDVLEALNDHRRVELRATYGDDFGNRYQTWGVIIPRVSPDGQPVATMESRSFEYREGDRWQSLKWTAGTQGGLPEGIT